MQKELLKIIGDQKTQTTGTGLDFRQNPDQLQKPTSNQLLHNKEKIKNFSALEVMNQILNTSHMNMLNAVANHRNSPPPS